MNDKKYKSIAKEMRKYHHFSFNLRGNLSSQQKSAITRVYNKYKKLINDDYIFIKNSIKINNIPNRLKSNKGYFIEKQGAKSIKIDKKTKSIKRIYKKGLKKQLKIVTYYFKNRIEEIPEFLNNPLIFIMKLLKTMAYKKPRLNTHRIIVANGATSHFSYSAPKFEQYVKDTLSSDKDIEKYLIGIEIVFY